MAAVLVLLTGCQNDDGNDPQQVTTLELMPFTRAYDEALQAATTRAWTPPSGFYPYGYDSENMFWGWSDLTYGSIGIYFTQGTSEPITGQFVHTNGQWKTNIKIAEVTPGTYNFYGYIPTDKASSTIKYRGENYEAGADLTLNLPTVTTNDYCVIVGAKKGPNPTTLDGPVTDLRQGDFAYNLVANVENHVYLLFDHLYSAVQFQIKVDKDYNDLRHIRLKQLKLVGYNGTSSENYTSFKSKWNVTVGLESNNDSSSPIKSFTYEAVGSDATPAPLFESEDGLLLTTTYQDCKGNFVLPFCDISNLMLETTYDVYDTNGDPDDPENKPDNLIRKDQKAVNKINTSVLFKEVLQRGKIYTVKLTVNPTYLYMMSEPDLDNPTIEVGS